jgi:5-formyltetrahydrofolate cyclo-ligase
VEQEAAARAIAARLDDVPAFARADVVAGYVAIDGEPSLGDALAAVRTREGRVLLPALRDDGDLDWADGDGDYVEGRHGLREPGGSRLGIDAIVAADVVIVPALAIDLAGRRLGQGGGAYDRALPRAATATPAPLVIAVVFDDEVLDDVPVEAHDVPVHMAVTPLRTFVFPVTHS